MLDHRRLSYFLAVAAERSFTRAAERLHVAQPALSRQVRQLEDELGVPLLVRGGADGVTPTAAGALLLERAPELLRQLDRVWDDARRVAGADRPGARLRLAYAASAAHGSAPPILAELHAREPDLAVQARMASTVDAIAGLRGGTLDAAILRAPVDIEGLAAYVVRREPQGVVMREGHPLAQGTTVALAALAGTTILIHPRDANPGRYDLLLRASRDAGFEPSFEEPLLAFDPTHSTVAASDRVSIVSDPGAGLPPGLVWLPIEPALTLDVVLLTPLVAAASPAAVASLVAAADAVARRSGWLGPERHSESVVDRGSGAAATRSPA
ncbi:MAG: LysR substrate-binding domain-containing protein [Solirubrobacteraceae bacterium]